MARLNISESDDIELQIPVFDAIDDYFDTIYESGSDQCSVGSGAMTDDGKQVLVYNAFRVDAKYVPIVRALLAEFSKQFAAKLTIDDPNFRSH